MFVFLFDPGEAVLEQIELLLEVEFLKQNADKFVIEIDNGMVLLLSLVYKQCDEQNFSEVVSDLNREFFQKRLQDFVHDSSAVRVCVLGVFYKEVGVVLEEFVGKRVVDQELEENIFANDLHGSVVALNHFLFDDVHDRVHFGMNELLFHE